MKLKLPQRFLPYVLVVGVLVWVPCVVVTFAVLTRLSEGYWPPITLRYLLSTAVAGIIFVSIIRLVQKRSP